MSFVRSRELYRCDAGQVILSRPIENCISVGGGGYNKRDFTPGRRLRIDKLNLGQSELSQGRVFFFCFRILAYLKIYQHQHFNGHKIGQYLVYSFEFLEQNKSRKIWF